MDLIAVVVLAATAWAAIVCSVIAMCSLAARADTLGETLYEELADRNGGGVLGSPFSL
jgi:methylmalonyl-CoA mutase cobalamin-binding subunit